MLNPLRRRAEPSAASTPSPARAALAERLAERDANLAEEAQLCAALEGADDRFRACRGEIDAAAEAVRQAEGHTQDAVAILSGARPDGPSITDARARLAEAERASQRHRDARAVVEGRIEALRIPRIAMADQRKHAAIAVLKEDAGPDIFRLLDDAETAARAYHALGRQVITLVQLNVFTDRMSREPLEARAFTASNRYQTPASLWVDLHETPSPDVAAWVARLDALLTSPKD